VSVADTSEHGFLRNREDDDENKTSNIEVSSNIEMSSNVDADDDDDTLSYQRSIIGGIRVPQRSKLSGRAAYHRAHNDDDNRSGISSQSSNVAMRGRGYSRR
jgi:hypothetical protein